MNSTQLYSRMAAVLLLGGASMIATAQDSEPAAQPEARFQTTEDGGVRDAQTGLIWAAKDNGGDIDWQAAQRYCQSQGASWRLPSSAELIQIYAPANSEVQDCIGKLTCKITPLIQLSGLTPWSNDSNGATEAFYVYLNDGKQYSYSVSNTQGKRALCVRNP